MTFVRRTYAGRDWHHPSVHALMGLEHRSRDPFEVIIERAREVVTKARALGWEGPPFDPVLLASMEGIRARPSAERMDSEALIGVLPDGALEIVWNDGLPPTRRNFSIFHELGHTLFPDAYEIVRHRSARRMNIDDELERLCDTAAAEMLMPVDAFSSDLSERDLNGKAVLELAQRYVASPEAVARRIATLSRAACAAVFLRLRLKPTEERQLSQTGFDFGDGGVTLQPKLRVDYVIPSAGFKTRLPEHKSIPNDSCTYAAVRGASLAAAETWTTGTVSIAVDVHAIEIPTDPDGHRRVLALIVLR